jgi:hypothetical protein
MGSPVYMSVSTVTKHYVLIVPVKKKIICVYKYIL